MALRSRREPVKQVKATVTQTYLYRMLELESEELVGKMGIRASDGENLECSRRRGALKRSL